MKKIHCRTRVYKFCPPLQFGAKKCWIEKMTNFTKTQNVRLHAGMRWSSRAKLKYNIQGFFPQESIGAIFTKFGAILRELWDFFNTFFGETIGIPETIRPYLVLTPTKKQEVFRAKVRNFLQPSGTWNRTQSSGNGVHFQKNAEHPPSACKRRRAPIAIFQKTHSLEYFVNFFGAHKMILHAVLRGFLVLKYCISNLHVFCTTDSISVLLYSGYDCP